MTPWLASLVIPTYNGKNLLARYLPSVVQAIDTNPSGHEVLVVDDGSTDGSAEFVRDHFPTIRVIEKRTNGGFSSACNLGASESNHSILVFLNNDIEVSRDFLDPLLRHFDDDSVFSVSPRIARGAQEVDEGVTRLFARFGFLLTDFPCMRDRPLRFENAGPIAYGCGGAVAVNKCKFAQMGGFDDLYAPAYSEDLDLGYRAWKRGWRVLHEPASVVYHQHSATMERVFTTKALRLFASRNKFLFMWKNMTDGDLIAKHLMFILPFCVYSLVVKHDSSFPLALVHACSKLPEVFRKRRQERVEVCLSDRDVLRYADCLGSFISTEGKCA